MIITLIGANFSENNIGTLDSYSIRFSGNVTNSNTSVDRESNTGYTTTITLTEGYELNGSITVTMGGTDITSTAVSGLTITIPTKVTGNVLITVPTKNTAGGEEDEPEIPDTPSPSNSTFAAAGYRLENNVQLASSGSDPYATTTKNGYHTFFDIPVDPETTYIIEGSVRVVMMTESKSQISSINVYTASNVGQQYAFKTTATTKYINVSILDTKVAINDAKLSNTDVSRSIESSQTISQMTGVSFVDNSKLGSSSYSDSSDTNYFTWKDIPVEAKTYYHVKGAARVWFLDSSKASLSSTNPTTGGAIEKFDVYTPANAAYMSVGFYRNNADSANEAKLEKLAISLVAIN